MLAFHVISLGGYVFGWNTKPYHRKKKRVVWYKSSSSRFWRRVVLRQDTTVLEDNAASIFRVNVGILPQHQVAVFWVVTLCSVVRIPTFRRTMLPASSGWTLVSYHNTRSLSSGSWHRAVL